MDSILTLISVMSKYQRTIFQKSKRKCSRFFHPGKVLNVMSFQQQMPKKNIREMSIKKNLSKNFPKKDKRSHSINPVITGISVAVGIVNIRTQNLNILNSCP